MLSYYRTTYSDAHLDLVLNVIEAENSPSAAVWIARSGGYLQILWDQANNVFYLPGEAGGEPTWDDGTGQAICASARRSGRTRFKLRVLAPELESRVSSAFPDANLQPVPTLFLRHEGPPPNITAPRLLPGVTCEPITGSLLEQAEGGSIVREEIESMWPAVERFYAHGFGFAAVQEGTILCWCTAEYLSVGACGIGIATHPHHEGCGLATFTAAHFIRAAHERGITPHWECARTNVGSVRVAEKVGFSLLEEHTLWVGSL